MDLKFFLDKNILDASCQFFKEILDINIAPAVKTEIKIQGFLKDQISDTKLLSKVADARIIGMINTLSINDSTTVADTDFVLKNPSEDYDMLLRVSLKRKIDYIDSSPLLIYRIRRGAISRGLLDRWFLTNFVGKRYISYAGESLYLKKVLLSSIWLVKTSLENLMLSLK